MNEGEKSPVIDPTQSTSNYQAPKLFEKIFDKNINKFKKNDGTLIEKGWLSIEKPIDP